MPSVARARGAALILCAGLCSCASVPLGAPDQSPPLRAIADPAVVSVREKLVEAAYSVVGKKELVIRGRKFQTDCTGTVLAIYWAVGIDLAQDFDRFSGNGVTRLFRTLERENLLYTTTHPLPGDIIFWDNSYDQNEDGQWNDPLTHVGMVVGVEPDATVSYVHAHVRSGIIVERMNLLNPDARSRMEWGQVKILNSPMRMAEPGGTRPARTLAGALYRSLGMGYLLSAR